MNAGNQNIAGYNIILNGKSKIVPKEDPNESLDNFKIKLIEAVKNYKEYNIISYVEDIVYLLNIVNMKSYKKLTDGNIMEINIKLDDDNFIEEIKKKSNTILKWAHVKELRELIDNIFESDITKNIYKNNFNIIFKQLFLVDIFKPIKNLKNNHDLSELDDNNELKQNVFHYYKKFILFLYDVNENPDFIEKDTRNISFNFYEIFKLVKNEFVPNKNNETILNILSSFKNGNLIIEISNYIYENDFFNNFEEIDLSKHSIF